MPPKRTKKQLSAKKAWPVPPRRPVTSPRKRAEEALREGEQELNANTVMAKLNELGMLFARGGTLPLVLRQIVDAAIAISGADFGNIQLLEPASGDLKIVAQRGFPKWWVTFWNKVSRGQGVCGTALERGQRVIVKDVEQSQIFADATVRDIQLKAGVHAVQSTPLVSRSGIMLGMFSTHYKTPYRPDKRTLQLLDLLARQAADLIERARAEGVLGESEQRFRAIYDHTYEFIGLLKPDGTMVDANQTALAFRGLQLSDVVGKPFWSTPWWDISPELQERVKAGIQQASEGTFVRLRTQHRAVDGTIEEIDFSLTPIRDQSGKVTQIISEGRRITALAKIQDELRQAKEELERRVQKRTRDLEKANAEMRKNQEALHRHQQRLQTLTGKLLAAQETERRRIAQELHDDLTQRLAALTIDLQSLHAGSCESADSLSMRIEQLGDTAERLTTDLQRMAHHLHPSILEHIGLEAAVREHIEDFEARTNLKTELTVRAVPTTIPLDHATCLYRVLQESLQNVRKHANATAVMIRLLKTERGVGLCVHDDGRGFDQVSNTMQPKGLGLTSMTERVKALRGTFRVRTKPGDGTEVHAWVPLEQGEV